MPQSKKDRVEDFSEIDEWFSPMQGENAVWASNPSFVLNAPYFIGGVVLSMIVLLGGLGVSFWFDLPLLVLGGFIFMAVLLLGITAFHYLSWKNHYYLITNKRVMEKTDILGETKSSKRYNSIEQVDTNQSTFEWLVTKLTSEEIGDIHIESPDDDTHIEFRNVSEYSEAEDYIEHFIEGGRTPCAGDKPDPDDMLGDEGDRSGGGETDDPFTQPDTTTLDREEPTQPSQKTESGSDDVFEPSDRA